MSRCSETRSIEEKRRQSFPMAAESRRASERADRRGRRIFANRRDEEENTSRVGRMDRCLRVVAGEAKAGEFASEKKGCRRRKQEEREVGMDQRRGESQKQLASN